MREIETINWNTIWVSMQELNAALRPLLASDSAPDWATKLDNALFEANETVEEFAMEETDDEPL